MADSTSPVTQDFQQFIRDYQRDWPEDVLEINEAVSPDQEITAVVKQLAAQGRDPVVIFRQVQGIEGPVITNMFASRQRVARLLGVAVDGLHAAYQQRSRRSTPPRLVAAGPVLDNVQRDDAVDLQTLPMLKHFASDRAPYITNGIMIAEHPDSGIGNMSYHRSMLHSRNELATSLHSRGDLWRLLQLAKDRGQLLPVAMVMGAHPLVMLAGSARVGFAVDERDIAGGLLGAPLEVVRTPRHGIMVPAHAEMVLEGTIDPTAQVDEGPFGEFTGYSSNRSTNNLFHVDSILRRHKPMLVDVMGGNSADHLNLGRIPRESEMAEKLKERFASVTALHYPNSGTHFHAYVALKQSRQGEARQVMLGLLGWDPYLKTVIAVDPDIDVTQDEQVLWALANHFQPHRDLLLVDGLPGSALDPSSSGIGTTSRMGLDATRGPGFEGIKAVLSAEALTRATELLGRAKNRS